MVEYYKKYLISCLKACLQEKSAPKPEQEIDWAKFYRLAKQNGVAVNVYLALKDTDFISSEELERYHVSFVKVIEKQEVENTELEELLAQFRNNNIPYMLIKGIITRKMYPKEYMRSSADIDIYYQNGYTDKVREVFFDRGYNLTFSGLHSDVYKNQPYVDIEMHKQLLSPLTKIGKIYKYNPFVFGITVDGLEYTMSNEDFYLFHFCHLAQHFYDSGAGIKFFMDIKVIRDILPLDFEEINLKLKKYKLKKFHDASVKLSDYWFNSGECDEVTETYESYVLSYGSYGSGVIFDYNRTDFGKRNRYISAFFPSAERLAKRYPDVRNKKYKVPYYWIKRAFDYKGTIKSRLKEVNSYGNSEYRKIKDFYSEIGL